jgi:uncharacterized protein YecT (DUF1311 family)
MFGHLVEDSSYRQCEEGAMTMNTKKLLLASALAFGLVGAAHAADCGDMNNQRDMNQCFARQLKTTEAAMNKLVAKLHSHFSSYDTRGANAFSEAQDAWKTYADKWCGFMTGGQGGSVRGTVVAMCFIGMIEARIKELDLVVNCSEGDMGCGR